MLPPGLTYPLGYSVLAALYWRQSNKWGALATVLWVVACMAVFWWLQVHLNPARA